VKPYFDENGVTIYHGDCRTILPQIESVDLVLTDPPYAMSGARKEWRVTASVATGIHYAASKVRPKGAMLCFTTTSARGLEFTLGAVGEAMPFNRLLIWHKAFVRSRVAGPWRWDLVAIAAFGRASFGRPEFSSLCQTSGDSARDPLDTGHPAEVPLKVADWLYTPFSPEIVLDPFMGSGSLLMPARRAGKRAIGIEVDERHCELAARRFAQRDLMEAALEDGGDDRHRRSSRSNGREAFHRVDPTQVIASWGRDA
jgi:site-specific DNA-methyltransferase (adenine-specific)